MIVNTTYNIRIDQNIKKQADKLYKNIGLSLSSAINLFLTQSIIQGKLPISEIVAEVPYAEELRAALAEFDEDYKNNQLKAYNSTEELFNEWDKEDSKND